jgi:hypothetical protein
MINYLRRIPINITKVLEKLSEYLWPMTRLCVKKSKRCRRCILSEVAVPLNKGLCEECAKKAVFSDQEIIEASGEIKKQFHERMMDYCNIDIPYHALLLLSGGKDSAYILSRIKTEYPDLKIICAFVNNGFSSPVAISNAVYVAEKFQTDLLIVNSYVDEFLKTFRKAFLNLDGRGSYGVVDRADGDLIFEVGQNIARNMKIPMIIGGLSWVQLEKIFGVDGFELKQETPVIHPLAVWRSNEQEVRSEVRKQELLPPGNDNPIVTNNTLILTMCALDVKNSGYCSFEPEFAQLVREGKTDRKTWLHNFELLEFATRKGFLDKEIKNSLARLNLALEDVVKTPKKTE